MEKALVYVVEDDPDIRDLELYSLAGAGFEARGFASGAEFQRALKSALPRLVLLDLMLPDEDGLSLLKRLRALPQTAAIPVILVTAKTTEMDKVKGLDLGADDYVVKPFGVMELLSRVRAVLRRAEGGGRAAKLSFKSINIDEEKWLVTVDGEHRELTYKEFELLKKLVSYPGVVFTRERLINEVWGFDYLGETRTVDIHIRTLRKKLGEAGRYILTVRHVGYKIGDDEN
ncbi:MAG: response regulator transcription factor [Spirochaetaceae bacterium]|jgi:two-component system alkaline phosphatase synthesis response regulator PhoP|nr:response regulator transcription factor [Spirochaetaceae bacterium]